MSKECVFKAIYWKDEIEKETNNTIIHIGGNTKEGETVHVFLQNYYPSYYIELPREYAWNENKCRILYEFLQTKKDKNGNYYGPVEVFSKKILQQKFSLYHKDVMFTLAVKFKNDLHAKKLAAAFNYSTGFRVYELNYTFPPGKLKMHHQNIPPVVKYAADRNLDMAGWIKVTNGYSINEWEEKRKKERNHHIKYVNYNIDSSGEDNSDEEGNVSEMSEVNEKVTTADIELYVDCLTVSNVTSENSSIKIFPKYCSFDIECYSENHNSKLPDPTIKENAVIQISMIFGNISIDKRHNILLSLGEPKKVVNCDELRTFKTEAELLLAFSKIIRKQDPSIFVGYNIMKFDWNYMIIRARDILMIYDEFSKISRVIGEKADIQKNSWSSSAYGDQDFSYFECHGRLMIDGLIEVERSYKLPVYRLDAVAEKFLGKNKDDVSPKAMFMIWNMTRDILPLLKDKDGNDKKSCLGELNSIKKKLETIFVERRCQSGTMFNYRQELLSSSPDNVITIIRKGMEIMGKYCMKDSELAIDLVEKLNLYPTMEEFSNVTDVPMSFLYTRGQQIKVVAQTLRICLKENIVIPFANKNKGKETYEGALVANADKGYHKNVGALDFTSLYPSLIIAFNICYTTLLKEEEATKLPESEYQILQWKSHKNCEHDPYRKTRKSDVTICQDCKYFFKKVKYVINKDGTITTQDEGVIPRLLKQLLGARKAEKRVMVKWEAIVKMNSGKASEDELAFYKKIGYKIIESNVLSKEDSENAKRSFITSNAKQLALKVASNSVYGILGAQKGMMPFVPGGASVTAMGRELITKTIMKLKEIYPNIIPVYGDTDSTMVKFSGTSLQESFRLCEEAVKKVTNYLKCNIVGIDENFTVGDEKIPLKFITSIDSRFSTFSLYEKEMILKYECCPINLDFENMYIAFLLYTKKRYVTYIGNKDGKVVDRTKKGMCEARRDNCQFLRDTSKLVNDIALGKIVNDILTEGTEEEIVDIINYRVNMLFASNKKEPINDPELSKKYFLPDDHLVITMSIKDIISYAKGRKETKDGREKKIPTDDKGNDILDAISPLDSRYRFPAIPHVLLALKILKRDGSTLAANTRLEFLYLEDQDGKKKQGERAEDFEYYLEHKKDLRLKPDKFYYIEKQLTKPITELLKVRFIKPIIPYIPIEDKIRTAICKLNESHRHRVVNIRDFKLPRPYKSNKFEIGWECLPKEAENVLNNKKERRGSDLKFKEYSWSSLDAKIEYMFYQLTSDSDVLENNPITKEEYPGLLDLCKQWKSNEILKKVHNKYGECDRKVILPVGYTQNVKEKKKIYIIKSTNDYQEGELGKIIGRREIDNPNVVKSKTTKYYLYHIRFKSRDALVNDVPRNHFTLYTRKDDCIMQNILLYRKNYDRVIKEYVDTVVNVYKARTNRVIKK